ncbi:MAG: DUF4178 domain-containing protein [Lachnospiraceae bacterium]|nr:DUF4178 domain-containing protein [Lachnospiraceae bacterium]
MIDYKVGTKLKIRDLVCHVIGYIEYANFSDFNKRWVEYRLSTNKGEFWLSVDHEYQEYSMSFAANNVRGSIGPEWHKVDEGVQKVVSYSGDVDVDPGETASFVEFEDESEEKILSTEIWSDGTEYSYGYYIEKEEIVVTGFEQTLTMNSNNMLTAIVCTILVLICIGGPIFSNIIDAISTNRSMNKYLEKSSIFSYVTSITGNQKQKADVYEYTIEDTTDNVAKLVINGINGYTESITQKDEASDDSIAILTKKEYCLIYHPEDAPKKVYVQVSNRKYNYTSDNEPYKSTKSNTRWYRSHYYSSGYKADSGSFKKMPSAYQSYSGDTIHNVGNGYFDSYSSSVRQASINSRSSSSGGGK